ncbi:DEKNAAC100492 [Brettanomyces naardenensis]|uniref:DEKNAAC100492 n=1 Tax=Brettanomyces naardenensis TaxID=13370 RepID=A0A448YGC6_BRENA|nr:DEKNAAC100492 [Brettanomyces naardenensis]
MSGPPGNSKFESSFSLRRGVGSSNSSHTQELPVAKDEETTPDASPSQNKVPIEDGTASELKGTADLRYERGPSLEEGIPALKTTPAAEVRDSLPFLSSILKELTLEAGSALPQGSGVASISQNVRPSQREVPYLDVFNDPLHFLNKQEASHKQRLQQLEGIHEKSLSSGSNNVNATRREILSILNDLSQGRQAMREIYTKNSSEKKAELERLSERESKKKELLHTIAAIETNSSEGRTYKILLDKVGEVDTQIAELEAKLDNFKNQRRLISQELMETRSLLDAKVNAYVEVLKRLEISENSEIATLLRNDWPPRNPISRASAIENLRLQIEAINDIVDSSKEEEARYRDSFIYLSDVFDMLMKLEKTLGTFIQEGKSDMIANALLNTRDYLLERLLECESFHMDLIKPIISGEYSTIVEALKLVGIESSPEESFEEVKISDANWNRKSRSSSSVGSIPVPASFVHPTVTASTILASPDNSVDRTSSNGNGRSDAGVNNIVVKGSIISEKQAERKYANLLTKMKDSKGVKKD